MTILEPLVPMPQAADIGAHTPPSSSIHQEDARPTSLAMLEWLRKGTYLSFGGGSGGRSLGMRSISWEITYWVRSSCQDNPARAQDRVRLDQGSLRAQEQGPVEIKTATPALQCIEYERAKGQWRESRDLVGDLKCPFPTLSNRFWN